MLEIASCFVEGANDSLVEMIYNLTIHSFQVFFKGWAILYFVTMIVSLFFWLTYVILKKKKLMHAWYVGN